MDSIAKINRILASRGLTGADLSRMLGISNSTYSTWNTRRNKISNINLHKIAKALEVPVESILPDQNEQEVIDINKETDAEMDEILEEIRSNPAMRVLFKKMKGATPEQLYATAQMVETFKKQGG